jgi:FkbM family methyltransferase
MSVSSFGRMMLRRGVLGRRALRRLRRHTAERLGSARYSRAGLYELDRKLEFYLGEGGFFVEAGANDGFRQSNTYYLERFRGWRGILVEPIPALAKHCGRERRRSTVYQCALVADEQATPKVDMRYADLLSETHATGRDLPTWPKWDETYDLTVPARTLASILAEVGAPRVDFLSLDVQGFEPAVLAGLDLPRFMPTFMLLELDDGDARRRVEEVIGSRYSLEAWLTHHDALYQCG